MHPDSQMVAYSGATCSVTAEDKDLEQTITISGVNAEAERQDNAGSAAVSLTEIRAGE